MIIGVDLDGTCGDYTGALRGSVASVLGLQGEAILENLPEPADYGFSTWKPLGGDFPRWHGDAVDEGLYQDIEVFAGVSETLHRLSEEGHRIIVITSRFVNNGQHATVVSDTAAWLDKHHIPYHDILFLRDKHLVAADVFIDDAPNKIEELRDAGKDVIVFDAPYNKDVEGDRASNWDQVYSHIQARVTEANTPAAPKVADARGQ